MDDSRIFIVGVNGQLGTGLKAQFADISELDITNKSSVKEFNWSSVDIILNAAAYTNVDGAETPEGQVAAWKVNAQAVQYLSKAALVNKLTLVHISTDYVFDGSQTEHSEDEAFSPLSVYGASKAAGDLMVSSLPEHYILRTSWVIGEGKNFVRTMLELGKKGVNPTVVSDQIGRLTFTSELVRAIDHLLTLSLSNRPTTTYHLPPTGAKAPYGTYNVSNDGKPASWAEITREIFKTAGHDLTVTDTTTAEYYAGKENIAPRPLQSTLDLSKLQATGFTSQSWSDALESYIKKELSTD
jgi:dTDP-4-dehydrorhamnose reductase